MSLGSQYLMTSFILHYLAFQSFDFDPDEGYSRNASCALH
jgi:hypothetical protein